MVLFYYVVFELVDICHWLEKPSLTVVVVIDF
jgi:hypothetical protein